MAPAIFTAEVPTKFTLESVPAMVNGLLKPDGTMLYPESSAVTLY